MDENGNLFNGEYPISFIQEVYDSGEPIYYTTDQNSTLAGFPLQTRLRKYGVLWLNIPVDLISHHTAELHAITILAAQTVERFMLIENYRSQANV